METSGWRGRHFAWRRAWNRLRGAGYNRVQSQVMRKYTLTLLTMILLVTGCDLFGGAAIELREPVTDILDIRLSDSAPSPRDTLIVTIVALDSMRTLNYSMIVNGGQFVTNGTLGRTFGPSITNSATLILEDQHQGSDSYNARITARVTGDDSGAIPVTFSKTFFVEP